MKKSDNIFVKAKAYRKEHPRTSFQDAIKKVSGKRAASKIAGAKKVTGVKKVRVAGTRKRITKPAKVGTSRPAAKSTDRIQRGIMIVRKIDKLEKQRKELKHRELKDIIQYEINSLHVKLNQLKRS